MDRDTITSEKKSAINFRSIFTLMGDNIDLKSRAFQVMDSRSLGKIRCEMEAGTEYLGEFILPKNSVILMAIGSRISSGGTPPPAGQPSGTWMERRGPASMMISPPPSPIRTGPLWVWLTSTVTTSPTSSGGTPSWPDYRLVHGWGDMDRRVS